MISSHKRAENGSGPSTRMKLFFILLIDMLALRTIFYGLFCLFSHLTTISKTLELYVIQINKRYSVYCYLHV